MIKHSRKGFTLIELLVVISIIGLLSSVVLVSLNSARTKARDANKLQTARSIATALELYRSKNGVYPHEYTNAGTDLAGMVSADLTGIMPALPSTLFPTGSAFYVSDGTGSSYELLYPYQASASSKNVSCSTGDYSTYNGNGVSPAGCFGNNVTAPLWTPPSQTWSLAAVSGNSGGGGTPPPPPVTPVTIDTLAVSDNSSSSFTVTWSATGATTCSWNGTDSYYYYDSAAQNWAIQTTPHYINPGPATSGSASTDISPDMIDSGVRVHLTCTNPTGGSASQYANDGN